MVRLSAAEQKQLAHAIRQAEAASSGEIVLAVTEQSGDWRAASIVCSISVALAFSLIAWSIRPELPFPFLWLMQIGAFLVCETILHFTGWGVWLVPASIREKAAARHAHSIFSEYGLHRTKDRGTILLFVSLREHYAELVVDEGIRLKEPPEIWKSIIESMTAAIKEGNLGAGLLHAVNSCASIQSRHLPNTEYNENELPDMLSV